MARQNTLTQLAEHIGHALARLADLVGSADAFRGVMLELGWRCDSVPAPIAALEAPARTLANALGDGSLTVDELPAVLDAIQQLVSAIGNLEQRGASMPASLVVDGYAELIPKQLIDHLLLDYLEDEFPLALTLLSAVGLVRETVLEDEGNRPGSIQHAIAWHDIPQVLANPRQLFVDAYGWTRDDFDASVLLEPLLDLGESLGLSVQLAALPAEYRAPLGYAQTDTPMMLVLPLFESAGGSAGLGVTPLPALGPRKPGVAILPFRTGTLPDPIHVTGGLSLSVRTAFDLSSVAVLLRPSRPVDILSPIDGPPANGTITATLSYAGSTGQRRLLLGSSDGTRLEAAAVSVTASAAAGGLADLGIEFQLEGGRLVIDAGEENAFLGALLGESARTIDLPAALGWSKERGAYLPGGAELALTLPSHLALGPITLRAIEIELVPAAAALDLNVGAALDAAIGPFAVSTDRLGLTGAFAFPGTGGTLGPIDAAVRFLPPTTLAFALDTEVVTGGGLIFVDPDTGRYTGGLALDLFGLGITAIVVIDTEVTGTGWALFASIGVVFPTPIPIGFGFTVIGVGGLIAVNRTLDVNALAGGLKTGAVDAILFPDDFLANATPILHGLDQWFPIQPGTTTFGPVAAMGWGNPTLITAQLGVSIALPDLIVALLGSVEVLLPTADDALLAFRMDIIGAVDIPASEVIVAASLHDSTLLQVYELSGDMGFYARLSGQPLFLLSIGGYHPQFDPPGALPSWLQDLRRTSASIQLAEDVQVTLTSYVALTSNTVQFGGRFKLVASVKVLLTTYTAEGWFGINLLLVLKPLKFTARASAGVTISAGDRELMGVQLTARLEGPRPWYASGSASFTFFRLDVDFGFELGGRPGGAPRELHDVGADVVIALRADGAWAPVDGRDAWGSGVVMTSTLPAGLWARPDQRIELRQNVAPLNRTISAFGEYVPASERVVASQVTLGGHAVASPEWIEDWFAPAQFDRLEKGDSLSAPSYELMTAGVRFGDSGVAVSAHPNEECTEVSRAPEESIFGKARRRVSSFVSPAARTRATSRTRGVSGPRLSVQPTLYTIVQAASGTRASAVLGEAGIGTKLTYVEAVRLLEARAATDGRERARLRVVPFTAAVA